MGLNAVIQAVDVKSSRYILSTLFLLDSTEYHHSENQRRSEKEKKKKVKEDEYCCNGQGLLGSNRAVAVVVLDWSFDASSLLKSSVKLKENQRPKKNASRFYFYSFSLGNQLICIHSEGPYYCVMIWP